ncbi:hypothetical protein C8K15_12230 [Paenisporosarcina sp. OV554]|nr:hypothetical protein C8K15_12230 [Paenisporosarcina sp. OV554]
MPLLDYTYTTSGETEVGTLCPPGTKYIRDSSEAGDGNMCKKDELIEVVVKWNEKEEKIPLKIKND